MVKIYTAKHCKFCRKAKRFLKEKEVEYEELSVEDPKNLGLQDKKIQ